MRGEGSRLWDQQGKEYIDFAGGIAVNALGHAHPALREALNDREQILAYRKWLHQRAGIASGEKLIDATFAERIFFCNSGAEANEAALKLARKYAHDRFGSQKSGIVAFKMPSMAARCLPSAPVVSPPIHRISRRCRRISAMPCITISILPAN